MSLHVDAIYDNGVLKPLVPLMLPDKSRVKLTVEEDAAPTEAGKLERQKAALASLWQELDKIPQHENKDGWSVRQHDEVLYGQR